jgi:CheY-like chemotaxis protein
MFLRLTLPQATFARVGVDFDQAEDGQKALEMVLPDVQKYDLILLDNQVKKVHRRLRGHEAARPQACPWRGMRRGAVRTMHGARTPFLSCAPRTSC